MSEKIRDKFDPFWKSVQLDPAPVGVKVPEDPPCHKKTPARIENGPNEDNCPTSVKNATDVFTLRLMTTSFISIKSRFNQPGFTIYKRLQNWPTPRCLQSTQYR